MTVACLFSPNWSVETKLLLSEIHICLQSMKDCLVVSCSFLPPSHLPPFFQVFSPGFIWALCSRHCHLSSGVHLQSELHQEPLPYCQVSGGAVCHQPCCTASYSEILWNDGEPPAVHQTAGPGPYEVLYWWVIQWTVVVAVKKRYFRLLNWQSRMIIFSTFILFDCKVSILF